MGNIFEDIAESVEYFRSLRGKRYIGLVKRTLKRTLDSENVKTIHLWDTKDENYDYENKLNKGDKK